MVGFIYKTTNLVNSRKYIGRKIYDDKWKTYLGPSKLLLKDIKTLGSEHFSREIIEECETYEKLQQRELYWQLHYKVKESVEYYNLVYANEGFDTSGTRFTYSREQLEHIWSKERRNHQSDRWKDPNNNPNNLEHVRKERSTRMKIKANNIFNDPEFIAKHCCKAMTFEYKGIIYNFKSLKEAKSKFGPSAIRARTMGIKKYNPFKGLRYIS